MKNYVLLDYDCDGIRDVVGVIGATDNEEFYSKVIIACSKYYKKDTVIVDKYGNVGEDYMRLIIRCGSSEYPIYLDAEIVEIFL